MTRISSFAANTLLVNQLLRTQSRLFDTGIQISSGKIAQNYEGIAIDSRRLINLENTRDSLRQYNVNNDRMDIRLKIANVAIEGLQELITDFNRNLNNFGVGGTTDKIKVQTIQENAVRTLKSIEDLLNTQVDGRFIFAGARIDTEPANFGLTTLANFQAIFDGAQIKIAETRDANLADFSINQSNSFSTKTFKSGTVSMTFDATADTITAAAGTFRYPDGTNLAAGAAPIPIGPDVTPVEAHLSRRRAQQSVEMLHEGRLARAARTQQRDEVVPHDVERDVLDDAHAAVSGGEAA